MDEIIVFLMRQFGWTLEYTVALVQNMEIGRLNTLVKEVQYQKSVDDYARASNFGMLIANWASSQGRRRYNVSNFIGRKPRRVARTQRDKDIEQEIKQQQLITVLKGEQNDRKVTAGS